MKQTNNAIKFLMAQYRAIFKNANLKMFLAAATAAAALAAGQAQAAALSDANFDQNNGNKNEAGTITENSELVMSKFDRNKFDGSAFTYAGTANGPTHFSGSSVNVTGHKDSHLAFAGLKLTDGASFTVNNTDKSNTKVFGFTSGTSAAEAKFGKLEVSGSSITGNKAAFKFQSGSFTNSTLTLDGLLLAEKNDGKFDGWDWIVSSNLGINKSGSDGGALTLTKSTINLNTFSNVEVTDSITLTGSTVNFNGELYQDKDGDTVKDTYASTLLLAGTKTDSGTITLDGGTVLNATGFGGVYADTITITDATANIADGKKLILDGKFKTDKKDANGKASVHSDATVNITSLSANGTGTLVIGHAETTGTTKITGDAVIDSKIENHTAMTVSGNGASLTVNADMIAKDAGVFASKSGSLTIQEGSLNLNGLSGDKTLDLADTKQITFAETAAQNKVAVKTSATIAGGNLAISDKIAGLGTGVKLSVDAQNLTLGSAKFDSSASDLGIGSGDLTAENVTFINKDAAKPFVLKNNLELETQGKGTIKGSLQVGAGTSGADVSIIAGDYTLEAGKDLLLVKSSGASALTIEDAKLTISGKLATKATEGVVSLNDGTLDASKATAYEFGANTFKMSGASALSLDGSKWFELGNASGDLVKFKDKVDATAVSGNKISTLTLTGIGSMSMEQFQELKTDTGFTGLFEGFNVTTKDPVSGSIEFGTVETGTPGSVYHNAQAIVKEPVADKTVNIGSIKLASGTDVLSLTSTNGSNLTLTNAAANGNTKNNFVSNSTGDVASVKFSGNADTVLVLQGAGNIGALDAAEDNKGAFIAGSFDGSKTADVVVKGNIGETKALNVVQAGERSKITVEGTIVNTNEFHSMPGSSFIAKKADISVAASGDSVTLMGDVEAKSLKFTATDTKHMIAGNAHIDVVTLTGASGTTIQVGDDSVGGLGATVSTQKLDLNSGSLFVDPEFGNPAAIVTTEVLSGTTGDKSGAGTLNGDAYVGKNAAFGIGFTKDEAGEALLKEIVGQYLTVNEGFDKNSTVKNALVINDNITISGGKGIHVSSDLTAENYKKTSVGDKLILGKDSTLVITESAFDNGAASAIAFSAAATVEADQSASVALVGDYTTKTVNGLSFFSAGNDTVTIANPIKLNVAGDLISAQIGTNGMAENAEINKNAVEKMRANVSGPIGDLLVASADGSLDGSAGEGFDYLIGLRDAKQFAAVDAVAHAATYAGAQQAAVAAVGTMAEAVGGRVGSMGVEAASIAATGSQANGGVWVAPMYKSVDADSFAAQGVSYGADVDLAGVAFGADTVNGNMRFGAVFNIGSGDADGKGQGNGLKDEFDYYGFGMYTVMDFGNLALVGDASLNVISHDIEGFSGLKDYGNAKGKADTTAVTMGITGQYTISNPMFDVTPHLGARFIRLDTESYDVNTNKGVVASTDFDVQNVFSIPLGVTLSKAFEMGGWSLAPSADLSITFNTGDTEVNSTTQFTGVVKSSALTTEVLDEVTYGINIGLGAQFGAFGTQIGINYTGSENTDAFGVNANARYMF